MTLKLINLAIANNEHLICLPPHTSHALQPLDVAVYKPAKSNWKKIVGEYFLNSGYRLIDKQNFPPLIKKLQESFKPENAISGFRKTGLYPLNKDRMLNDERLALSSTLSMNQTENPLPNTPTTTSTPKTPHQNVSLQMSNSTFSPITRTRGRKLDYLNEIRQHSQLVTQAAKN